MLKRLLAISLCLCLAFSLAACGDTTDDTPPETLPRSTENQQTDPTINEATDPVVQPEATEPTQTETESTKPQIEPFDYYLIPLHKEVVELNGKTYTNLWIVFQLAELEEFFIMPSDHGFDVNDKSTGENLIETENVEFFHGSACTETHSPRPDRNIPDSTCVQQVTILISAKRDINFEDIEIVATPYIKIEAQKDRIQTLTYQGAMTDLDLKHELIHGNTIFAVGDKYYVKADGSGITWGPGKCGVSVNLIAINGGTAEDFLNATTGKVSLVYGSGASQVYHPEGYTDDMYLKPMSTIPENCELWYETEDDIDNDLPMNIVDVKIGIKSIDGSKFEEDGVEEKTGFSGALCFTHEDGTITVFSDR